MRIGETLSKTIVTWTCHIRVLTVQNLAWFLGVYADYSILTVHSVGVQYLKWVHGAQW